MCELDRFLPIPLGYNLIIIDEEINLSRDGCGVTSLLSKKRKGRDFQ